MDPALQTTLLIVAGVGGIAWLMKAFSGEEKDEDGGRSEGPNRAETFAEDLDDDRGEGEESAQARMPVPLSAEGVAFVPRPHGVLLLPLLEAEEETPSWLEKALDSSSVPYSVLNRLYFSGAGGGARPHRPGTPLGVGDLTGARIVRGLTGADRWRLETLGRDGDFGFHPFTTREGADAAFELLVDHDVVKRPIDEDGNSVPVSPEDFEEARRRYEVTESELAIESDDDERPREGPWVSDRR